MAAATIIIKVKLMSNKWVEIAIDDINITGADLMQSIDQIDSNKYTMLNHANFKKLVMNKSIATQIKHKDKWEVIPIPNSS